MRSTPEAFDNLTLGRAVLDRRAELRDDPVALAGILSDETTRVVEMRDGRCRVVTVDGQQELWHRAPRVRDADRLFFYLGLDPQGHHWVAISDAEPAPAEPDLTGAATALDDVDEEAAPWRDLREIGGRLDDRDAGAFTTALGLHNWHSGHTHCTRCGAGTQSAKGGWIRVCPVDGSEHYPRTDPAVIMSVVDDSGRLLLARGATWPEGRMSVLAGFVEPGETMAQAVAREVREEVGLEVVDVEFLADQPWPFPSSLMLGFTARATSTRITLQDSELAEAMWVAREDVPALVAEGRWLPMGRLSIASRLVEHWYGGRLPRVPR